MRVECLTNGELWQDEVAAVRSAVHIPHPTAARRCAAGPGIARG
jgi:GMP synthase PP-ATPase subunit